MKVRVIKYIYGYAKKYEFKYMVLIPSPLGKSIVKVGYNSDKRSGRIRLTKHRLILLYKKTNERVENCDVKEFSYDSIRYWHKKPEELLPTVFKLGFGRRILEDYTLENDNMQITKIYDGQFC